MLSPAPPTPTAHSAALVELTSLTVTPHCKDLNLKVYPGECVVILGPNGVGKTTLLRSVLGLHQPLAGQVRRRGTVGYLPQQRMFAPDLPARPRDLVSLALAAGVLRRRRPRQAEVEAVLARVGALEFADRRVGQLSGGQQQRVRQAQAIAGAPDLIVADEPLLSLDHKATGEAIALLAAEKARGAALLCVTHSLNPFSSLADRVLYLGPQGYVVGSPAEVFNSEHLSALYGTEVTVLHESNRWVVL